MVKWAFMVRKFIFDLIGFKHGMIQKIEPELDITFGYDYEWQRKA